MATKALLIDLPRCTGCRGCQVACKQEYKRAAEKTTFFGGPGFQNPADLSAETWCLVTYNEVLANGRYDWVFGKRQCMHCVVPGCASACPVKALEKLPDGPVVYHRDKCIGCRYCMLACPYKARSFAYEDIADQKPHSPRGKGTVQACTLCVHRVDAGLPPACVEAAEKVAPGAVVFGDLKDPASAIAKKVSQFLVTRIRADLGVEPGVLYGGL